MRKILSLIFLLSVSPSALLAQEKEFGEAAKEAAHLLKDNHGSNLHYEDIINDLEEASPSSDIQQTLMHMLMQAWFHRDKATLDALTILAQSPEGLVQINTYLTKINHMGSDFTDKKWPEVKNMILFKQTKYKIAAILEADPNTKMYHHWVNVAGSVEDIAENLLEFIHTTPGTTVYTILKKLSALVGGETAIEKALQGSKAPETLQNKTLEQVLEILENNTKEWDTAAAKAANDLKTQDGTYYKGIVKDLETPGSVVYAIIDRLLFGAHANDNLASFEALKTLRASQLGQNIIDDYLKRQDCIAWSKIEKLISEKQKKAGS